MPAMRQIFSELDGIICRSIAGITWWTAEWPLLKLFACIHARRFFVINLSDVSTADSVSTARAEMRRIQRDWSYAYPIQSPPAGHGTHAHPSIRVCVLVCCDREAPGFCRRQAAGGFDKDHRSNDELTRDIDSG